MMRFFVGWDPGQAVAYHVLSHSLIRHASGPISITPLDQDVLRRSGYYWRRPDTRASTPFSLTRFLVPALCGYEGIAVYMDCDMLALSDPCALADYTKHAVSVCQHDYVPGTRVKMGGYHQANYPRKNWSSLMVFDTGRCATLTVERVNAAPPAVLHRFDWLENEDIGAIPLDYNWLVGEYPRAGHDTKILHFTLGGPWLPGNPDFGHSEEWWNERSLMLG